jgi:hypothetical protein
MVCRLAAGAKEIRTLRPTLNTSIPRGRPAAHPEKRMILRGLGRGTGRARATSKSSPVRRSTTTSVSTVPGAMVFRIAS